MGTISSNSLPRPPNDLSILVVDDARFSAAVIIRALKAAGYQNTLHVESAMDALDMVEQKTISIIIADWLMPEMDGLELTQRIRQLDEAKNRYTYIIMLTARDGIDAMKQAFDEGVDDFINKSAMQQQLLPRIFAAERLVNNQNRLLRDSHELLQANQLLQKANATLKDLSTLDALTGLGNKTYNYNKVHDNLRHVESRGGAVCCILLHINGLSATAVNYPPRVINELIVGVSRRLKGLVRPLDDISRVNKFTFSIVTHQTDINLCVGASFKRILEAINHRAFQTTVGFKEITVEMSIAAAGQENGLPSAKELIDLAEQALQESIRVKRIHHIHYRAPSG